MWRESKRNAERKKRVFGGGKREKKRKKERGVVSANRAENDSFIPPKLCE